MTIISAFHYYDDSQERGLPVLTGSSGTLGKVDKDISFVIFFSNLARDTSGVTWFCFVVTMAIISVSVSNTLSIFS